MSAPQQRSRAPKGSFRPHARYVPKTDIASSAPANAAVAATSSQSASSDRKPTPPLTTSLRSTATAKPSTENKGDGRSVGSSFVRYLPQDEAVASGLGADAGGLDTVESQAVVDFLNDELCRLLKMKPRDFWKDVAKNESLHQFLDSYLQFRSRWYDFPHRGSRGMVAGVIVGEADLCRRVFLVLYRISSNRDPGALASDGLSVKDHTALLQEKKLLDLPKLLDICAIYGHENGELIKSLENFSVSTNVLITLPPYTSYSAMDPAAGSKRPRTDDTATETAPMDTSTAIVVSKQQTAKSTTSISTSKVKPTELIPRTVELLSLTVNPEYHQRLISSGELGYERPALRRIQEARYYEIDLDAFKRAMQRILLAYLAWKLNEQEILTIDEIDIEVNRIAPIIVDACITALYSKMRVIHIQYAKYMTRFINLPTYARDVELPLPFADAIQNFGVYQPQNVLTNFIYIPVFPEGIQNEGRSSQEWNVFKYEAYVPILKSLGIPVKSVDTRIKVGSPWWLYRVNIVDSQFDLRCIFPPSNYSDHSALCASMFITFDDCGENFTPIVKLKNDDPDYPVRFREIAVGFQLRAFSSLCHAPKVEWSQALLEI